MPKLAVVLFNLGGPDSLDAVQPFLFNLFNDVAIISVPQPIRYLLARFISSRRAPEARAIYDRLGGKSPLLELTREQTSALEKRLNEREGLEARCFVSMRYWHPRADETASEVARFEPDEIVLLPLYPQFSTTTTESSIGDWLRAQEQASIKTPTKIMCCYPIHDGWISALVELTRSGIREAAKIGNPRILFSAHGLPKKIIDKGDPYQWQVEQTAKAVMERLGESDMDWVVCYQSRVGPLQWIGPSIDEEIIRAARDQKPVVVVPIAFVSEHSETLVELDIEYRERAEELGVPGYVRVPAVATHERFIDGLLDLVMTARLKKTSSWGPADDARKCPSSHARCPMRSHQTKR